MKNISIILAIIATTVLTSCVQKSYKRTVHFAIDVKGIKDIKTVGIRGEKPLDWNYDLEMKMGKDSIYETTVVFETGYKCVTYKFTINNQFELENKDNRKVYFAENGVTNVLQKFNVVR